MSDRPSVITHDPTDDMPPAPPAAAVEDDDATPELPRLGNASIVDAIRSGFADEREDTTRVYKVGRTVPQLFARYRPLDDDEREAIDRKIRERVKRQKRVGQYDEGEAKIEEAAIVLSRACVELVWEEDGEKHPLHARLGEDTVFRYDAHAVEVLGLDGIARFAAAETSADITAAMHFWAGNHGPLLSTYSLYKVWAQGVDVDDLSEALEGN